MNDNGTHGATGSCTARNCSLCAADAHERTAMTKVTTPACCGRLMSLVEDADAGYTFSCSLCGRTKFVGKAKSPPAASAAPIPPKVAHRMFKQAFRPRIGKGTWPFGG